MLGSSQPRSFKEIVGDAEAGNANSQYNLALIYDRGHKELGIEINPKEALKWYDHAAKQNHTEAQFALGMKFQNGAGVPQNYQEANRLFNLAAEKNHAFACYYIAINFKKGNGVKQNNLKMIEWYYKAYQNGFSIYPQEIILDILIQFCNDSRFNENKKYFSDDALRKLSAGHCAGLTARFVVGAYLEKIESKSEDEVDNLTRFHNELDTIVNWDGQRRLTSEEQSRFRSFLYLMFGFQHRFGFDEIGQHELNRFIFLNKDKEPTSFKRELGCILYLTQSQLAKTLDRLRKENRMMFISAPEHAVGLFENDYYGPNNYKKGIKYVSSDEIAEEIFKEMKCIPEYRDSHTLPISIEIFAHLKEPIPATYPTYSELLENSEYRRIPFDSTHKYTPLHLAAIYGHAECLEYYLKETKCDVNAKDKYGKTALHYATKKGDLESVKLFLNTNGIKVNEVNYKQRTALHFAAKEGHVECVKLFLLQNEKCNINAKDLSGRTPLHHAAKEGKIECIKLFVNNNRCKINQQDSRGLTAFHLACSTDLESARLLLANGAELSFPPKGIWDKSTPSPEVQTALRNIEQLMKEKMQNLSSSHVKFWIHQQILSESAASTLSPDERFILKTAKYIATKLNILPLVKEIRKNPLSREDTIRNILIFIKNKSLENESKDTEEVNAFCKALSAVNITNASMRDIRNALKTSFQESCQISESQFVHIKDNYSASKNGLFASKSSESSQNALKAMSNTASNDSRLRAEIALKYIKDHPKNELAKQIEQVVPGFRILKKA